MKKIAIIGGLGNMGRRYKAILEALGCEPITIDIGGESDSSLDVPDSDGYIIATPTKNHVRDITWYSRYDKPILCEKPISKNLSEVEKAVNVKCPLRMINQYEYFMKDWHEKGGTGYDYFKSGSDSLLWDCINIIGLAKGIVDTIANNSPIWDCWINGKDLNISEMDRAYIWNIEDWLYGSKDNREYIIECHKKVKMKL